MHAGSFTSPSRRLIQLFGIRLVAVFLLHLSLIAEPSWMPIPDLIVEEDSGVQEVSLILDPAPFPASAFQFAVSTDNPELLPLGSLILVGASPTPSLRLQSAPDASGEAWVSVIALADGGLNLTNGFRVRVLPVDDPPRIEPIPNQVFVEGFSPLVLPIVASDPDSPLGLLASVSDPFHVLSASIQYPNGGPLLVLNYSSGFNISPTRSLVTVSANSRNFTSSISFYVSVQRRDLTPNGRSQSPPRWDIVPGPLGNGSRGFVWADVNRDGYLDLTSFGSGLVAFHPRTGSQPTTTSLPRGGAQALRASPARQPAIVSSRIDRGRRARRSHGNPTMA